MDAKQLQFNLIISVSVKSITSNFRALLNSIFPISHNTQCNIEKLNTISLEGSVGDDLIIKPLLGVDIHLKLRVKIGECMEPCPWFHRFCYEGNITLSWLFVFDVRSILFDSWQSVTSIIDCFSTLLVPWFLLCMSIHLEPSSASSEKARTFSGWIQRTVEIALI